MGVPVVQFAPRGAELVLVGLELADEGIGVDVHGLHDGEVVKGGHEGVEVPQFVGIGLAAGDGADSAVARKRVDDGLSGGGEAMKGIGDDLRYELGRIAVQAKSGIRSGRYVGREPPERDEFGLGNAVARPCRAFGSDRCNGHTYGMSEFCSP